jgi:hypothetical protein
MDRREQFLKGALDYVRALQQVHIVRSIALFGSLTTEKPDPKDVDLLIVLTDTVKLERLPKGNWVGLDDQATFDALVSLNQTARGEKRRQLMQRKYQQIDELFVATSQYQYIGRLSLDYDSFPLRRDDGAINPKPLEILFRSSSMNLWPSIQLSGQCPQDVFEHLIRALQEDGIP